MLYSVVIFGHIKYITYICIIKSNQTISALDTTVKSII